MRTDIFQFTDAAGAQKWADPLAVERRLRSVLQSDPRQVFAELLGADVGAALAAAERLATAACYAFDLGPPLDPATGLGVVEAVWVAALRGWVEWMEKNADGGSTSPTCSEATPVFPLKTAAGYSA